MVPKVSKAKTKTGHLRPSSSERVAIEDFSAILDEQSEKYLLQLGSCHVCLYPHTRTDPQNL
jgi:hypothetical protein